MGSLPSEATHTLLCREGVEHPASSQKYQPKVTHITSTHIPLVTGSYMVVSGCEGVGKKMLLARLGPLQTSPHRQWGSTDLGGQAAITTRVSVTLHSGLSLSSSCLFPSYPFLCFWYHTGHSGRFISTGIPRWVQVPEGVIYATITLGTACPQSWNVCDPMPAACCLGLRPGVHSPNHHQPLPVFCAWVLHVHAVCHPSRRRGLLCFPQALACCTQMHG